MHGFGLYVAVAAVVIVAPGPDFVLTLRNALRGGHKVGVRTAAGVAMGQMVWATTVAVGVSTVLTSHGVALHLLQLTGGFYLILLGVMACRNAATTPRETPLPQQPRRMRLSTSPISQGLFSNLSNPKSLPFFTGLLPQFVTSRGHELVQLLILGSVMAAMTFCWLTVISIGSARAGQFLKRDPVRRRIEALCGATFLGLGGDVVAAAARPV